MDADAQNIMDVLRFMIESGLVVNRNVRLNLPRSDAITKPVDKFITLGANSSRSQVVAGAVGMLC